MSLVSRFLERLFILRIFSRLPLQVVILAAVARPGIEGIDDVLEFGFELWNRPHQDALERGRIHLVGQ